MPRVKALVDLFDPARNETSDDRRAMGDADTSLTWNDAQGAINGVALARVASALEAHGIDMVADVAPRPIGRFGACVDVAVESDGGDLVLRIPARPGFGHDDLAREFTVLEALHSGVASMPTPVCHNAGDAESPPFMVLRGLAGQSPFAEGVLDVSSKAACERFARTLAAGFADLHGTDRAPLDAALPVPRAPFVRRVLQGWRKRAEVVTEHTPPGALMELVDWVEDAGVSDPDDLVPVHNQVSLRRLRLTTKGAGAKLRYSAPMLLDWGALTVGDPLVDLGTLLVGWPDASDPGELRHLDYVLSEPPALSRADFAEVYAGVLGVSISDLPFYRVLGLMRAAVFELKRFARVRRGLQPGIEGLDHAEVSECLLDLALDVSMSRAT